jgi:hypothetical protein
MAVAYDAATDIAVQAQATNPIEFTHTPAGTPRGVLLFLVNQGAGTSDLFGAVTYGGVSMTAVSGARAVDTGGEPGQTKAYFLGASVPTGAQTVSIAVDTAALGQRWAICITLTAAADTAISGTPVLVEGDAAQAEQNVDSGADVALRFACIYSGFQTESSLAAGANSTLLLGADFGSMTAATVRETTAGSGSRPVGFFHATPDDQASVHLAIAESGGGPPPATARSFIVIAV